MAGRARQGRSGSGHPSRALGQIVAAMEDARRPAVAEVAQQRRTEAQADQARDQEEDEGCRAAHARLHHVLQDDLGGRVVEEQAGAGDDQDSGGHDRVGQHEGRHIERRRRGHSQSRQPAAPAAVAAAQPIHHDAARDRAAQGGGRADQPEHHAGRAQPQAEAA